MSKKFYWGNSSSSMQTEGAYNIGGKGPSVYDIKVPTASDWKDGIDAYHRYEEDFDLMKDMGMNFYRFQISWSRVNPDGDGEFNEEGIEFYDKFIDALIDRGIEPMICLYHFDMPLNLAQKYNGFLHKHVVNAFVRFGEEMVKRFSNKVKYWVTFNEQNLYSTPWAFEYGGTLTAEYNMDNLYQIAHNIMVSHARVAKYIHDNTECLIGGMLAYSNMYPATCHPMDIKVAREWDEFINYNLINAFTGKGYSRQVVNYVKKNVQIDVTKNELEDIKNCKSDYIAFSYYCTGAISHEKIPEGTCPNEYLKFGEKVNEYVYNEKWNISMDPLGFRDIINKIYTRYEVPIFPVENGIGVHEVWDGKNPIDDEYRIEYHKKHIEAMWDAINIDGVDVLGYLGWGLIDLLSSTGDMEKRYGAVYVNRGNKEIRDMRRVPKKSYYWFKNFLGTNK